MKTLSYPGLFQRHDFKHVSILTEEDDAVTAIKDVEFNMNSSILLIEDNEFIRDNTEQMLTFANFYVTAVPNGMAALEMLSTRHFDLVISDMMMPQLDGFGVLDALKSNPETAGIPFIFLTARTASHSITQAFEMGADDYVMKPFHEQELLVAVQSCLQKNGMVKERTESDYYQ